MQSLWRRNSIVVGEGELARDFPHVRYGERMKQRTAHTRRYIKILTAAHACMGLALIFANKNYYPTMFLSNNRLYL